MHIYWPNNLIDCFTWLSNSNYFAHFCHIEYYSLCFSRGFFQNAYFFPVIWQQLVSNFSTNLKNRSENGSRLAVILEPKRIELTTRELVATVFKKIMLRHLFLDHFDWRYLWVCVGRTDHFIDLQTIDSNKMLQWIWMPLITLRRIKVTSNYCQSA